jgi:hypothetical protein
MRCSAGWRPERGPDRHLRGGSGVPAVSAPGSFLNVVDFRALLGDWLCTCSTAIVPSLFTFILMPVNKRARFHSGMHLLSLKVHLSNIRGLHSNLAAVHHHLETDKPHMLCLTETQIRCPTDAAYLHYPGYTLEHAFIPRAGVCVYARDDICCRRLRNLEAPGFSILWLLVELSVQQIVYALIYRSHSGDQETTRLFEHLSEAAEVVQQRYPRAQLVFLGDFNAHHQEWLYPYQLTDHAGRETRKFALSLDLTQLVDQPTRIPDVASHTPNCLDLLLTTDPDSYNVSVSSPLGTSDHCLVKFVSSHSSQDLSPRGSRRVWRYKSADWDEMRHFFASYPWLETCFTSDDPSICANAVTEVLRQGMEYFVPYSDVSTGGRARPWFSTECAQAEALKHSAYLSWADARVRKDPNVRAKKQSFNRAAKFSKKVIQKARFLHVSRIGAKLASYPSGSKAFWSLAKSVESNFCHPSLPPLLKPDGLLAHTAEEKANLFASLFAENSRLDAGTSIPPLLPNFGASMPDIKIHQREVLKTLRCLVVNKASGPDGIPAIVLKTCAPELSPVLTRLFRLSLKTGLVPQSWKFANVQPVPKKGSRADPSNYRPIAITSILCKIMERVLNNKLLAYLEGNDLLSDRQFGFRRNRSTGDLLIYATHLWGESVERHGEAIAVSLDISKAFDRVWHDSLIGKLTAYGISSGLCSWIADFLRNRSIRVVVDGCSSDLLAINAGVPQGSVLSATLFLLHINDLLKPGIFGYADDSTVTESYFADARTSSSEIQSLREAMVSRTNLALESVADWGKSNLVHFNAAKTQACLFTAKRSQFTLAPVFQNVSVTVSDHLELLGISLRPNLNFGSSIESKAKTAARKLGVLFKVKRYFTPKQLLTLYQAQVRSCMEYCCHLWDGSAKYQLAALDSVERRAHRLFGNDSTLKSKLQSLEHRRRVACLSVFYRIHFGECAQELHNLIPPSPFHHRTTRRGERMHPYVVNLPFIRTKRFASSFLMRTAKEWNSLPSSVFPENYDLGAFKTRVNRLLLNQ